MFENLSCYGTSRNKLKSLKIFFLFLCFPSETTNVHLAAKTDISAPTKEKHNKREKYVSEEQLYNKSDKEKNLKSLVKYLVFLEKKIV